MQVSIQGRGDIRDTSLWALRAESQKGNESQGLKCHQEIRWPEVQGESKAVVEHIWP